MRILKKEFSLLEIVTAIQNFIRQGGKMKGRWESPGCEGIACDDCFLAHLYDSRFRNPKCPSYDFYWRDREVMRILLYLGYIS